MTTLATNKMRVYGNADMLEYPVIASDVIYQGAAVGENASGYARPLSAGDVFLGFAEEKADNADGSAGDIRVRVKSKGYVKLPITSIAITCNDRVAVYASDDDTFTTTKGSNSLIGHVAYWVSTGYAMVEFDSALAAAELSALAQAIAADGA